MKRFEIQISHFQIRSVYFHFLLSNYILKLAFTCQRARHGERVSLKVTDIHLGLYAVRSETVGKQRVKV